MRPISENLFKNDHLNVIIFLTVSVLPNIFLTRLLNVYESISNERSFILTHKIGQN